MKKVYQSTLILVFQLDVEQITTEENDRGEASSQKSSADGEITAESKQSILPYQSENVVSIYLNLGFFSLTLNKLRQKRMIEEKLAHKRAQQMEKLQLNQNKVFSLIKVKTLYQSTLILVFSA